MLFKATNIKWDTDGDMDDDDLPTEVIIEAKTEFDVADALSDKYGWTVSELDVTTRFVVEYTLDRREPEFFPVWATNREDAVYQCCEKHPEVESVTVFAPVEK